MSICLDAGVIIVFVLTVIWCYRRGFVKAIFGLFSTLISVVLASVIGSWLSELIYNSFIKEKIVTSVNDSVQNAVSTSASNLAPNGIVLPEYLDNLLKMFGYDSNSLNGDISSVADNTTTAVANSVESAVAPIFLAIISFVLMIILFFVIRFITAKLSKLISKAMKLPVLSTVNRLLGGALGIIEAFVLVTFLAYLTSILIPLVSGGDISYGEFNDEASKTVFFTFFYDNNILTSFFGKI